LGIFFESIFDQIGAAVAALDVMIALGTHQPMSEEAICHRLEISLEERRAKYGSVRLFNHEWNNPLALKRIGTISEDEGLLLVPKAGEMLYHLRQRPGWAREM
jgi:nickel-dependent lactate racemase